MKLKNATADDPVQQVLRSVILRGWPGSKGNAPESVRLSFDMRDELTAPDELVFKGQQLVVPRALRKEFMEKNPLFSHRN